MARITVRGQRRPKGRALDSKEEAKMDSKRLLMCGRNGALFEKANQSSRSKALTLRKMRLLFWRKDGKLSPWNMPLTSIYYVVTFLRS